jgi:hypothetical protein
VLRALLAILAAAAALAASAAAPATPDAGTRLSPPPAPSIPIERGAVTTVIVSADVGAPVERAVPSRAYARAAAADAEQRWTDADALYADAISEWRAAARAQPSTALDLAILKAERERQRSQQLALRARAAANRARDAASARGDAGPRDGRGLRDLREASDRLTRRIEALEEARLLRAKLMAVRAVTGRVPAALYTRTRERLDDALRLGLVDPTAAGAARDAALALAPAGRGPSDAEIYLLQCAVRAAAGEPEAARLARAHVTQAERDDPANIPSLATCAATLGETRAALAALELVTLHPGPGPDRFGLRDLYISNDWDRLRGDPRFESLFRR